MRFGGLILGAVAAGALVSLALAAELTPDSPDPFLWLADIHGAKPLAWAKQQNDKTFARLRTDPEYRRDYNTILKVLDANDRIAEGQLDHGDVFNFWQDAHHVRGLWRKTTIADYRNADPHWQTLLDIDKLDADEHTPWVWQGADCAPGFTQCLLRLSPGGGDASAVREFDPNTGKFLTDGFTLAVAKSNATYVDKDTVLFATDFGPGSMTDSSYPRIVKIWHRGEPVSAAKTVFEVSKTDIAARPVVFRGPYGSIALVERGLSFFANEYSILRADGTMAKLPVPTSANLVDAIQGQLIFKLRDDWKEQSFRQGSLIAFDVTEFAKSGKAKYAVLFAPGERTTVEDVSAGRDAVYAAVFHNVTGSVHAFRPKADGTWSDETLDLPAGGSAGVVSANAWGPEAYFTYQSFLTPPTLYAYDGQGKPDAIKAEPARFDASNMTSEQFEATSADGTKVPYFLIRPKGAEGPLPTILYSYGGFELSLTPWYWNDGHRPLDAGGAWVAKGGAIAVANIRGGGEFGPAWHQAALKTNRQRAFDDFEAVASDLKQRGVAAKIGSVGASNGGVLVTATMTQRPDLFSAVIAQRPLVDMLRYTKYGAGASWVEEYGDPADPAMRAAILKYSAYENLKPGVKYPPIFFITETSDDRVTPIFARMMAAKMQSEGKTVLFYESPEGGHGPGATHAEEAEMWALSYVYFAQELGLEKKPVVKKPAGH
ncbi:MAG TPA: prolyl oligopeptidase family serine peptidase [Rhizomicrobium sp.]|jgi:prolyl oligopeptidase